MRACMHGWMDGWMDGWMNGWMDVHKCHFEVIGSIQKTKSSNKNIYYVGSWFLFAKHEVLTSGDVDGHRR